MRNPRNAMLMWTAAFLLAGIMLPAHAARVVATTSNPSSGVPIPIVRVDLDGSNLTTLLEQDEVRLAAQDSGELVWLQDIPTTPIEFLDKAIRRGPTASGACPTLQQIDFSTGVDALDLDGAGNAYYTYRVFADGLGAGGGVLETGIVRLALDGSDFEVIIPGLDMFGVPGDLAVDRTNSKVYWVESQDFGEPELIRRAYLDGSAIETILTFTPIPSNSVPQLFLDPAAGKIYWSGNGLNRANLDGSNPEILSPASFRHFIVDSAAEKVYWLITGSLLRSDLDGTNEEVVVSSSLLGNPQDLIFDPDDQVENFFCNVDVPATDPRGALLLAVLLSLAGMLAPRFRP